MTTSVDFSGFKARDRVTVATATGTRPAIVVDGLMTRIGHRIKVRLYYPAPITGGVFGAIRTFHVDDIKLGGWSKHDRQLADALPAGTFDR